jgi:hypothetical protein
MPFTIFACAATPGSAIFCDKGDRLHFLKLLDESHRRFDVAILRLCFAGKSCPLGGTDASA